MINLDEKQLPVWESKDVSEAIKNYHPEKKSEN